MPLNSPPLTGYPAWQRIGNYDSGSLWTIDTGSVITQTTSPILNVSRYAYLGGRIQEVQSACYVAVQWYADAAATVAIAGRNIALSNLIGQPAIIRLPNLGPYCKIIVTQLTGGNYHFKGLVFGTNRVHPLEFIPASPVLIDVQSQAIGAGSTVQFYPTDYYSGPVQLLVEGGQAAQLTMGWLTNAGAWDLFFVTNVPAGTFQPFSAIVTPPGAWRVAVENTGGAADNYLLSVIHSGTGAT